MAEKMTLRKFVYRYIYLKTPGWELTRQIAKKDTCSWKGCKRQNRLHLHHMSYTGFQVWYLLFRVALISLFFTEYAWWLLLILAFVPDFLSEYATLCEYHHDLMHLQKRTK